MRNYRQTSTGAVADVDFSEEVEKRNQQIAKELEEY
jgi:hypothetical protein